LSEQQTTLQLVAYLIGMIPGIYFAYLLIVEAYHLLKKKDEDFLK